MKSSPQKLNFYSFCSCFEPVQALHPYIRMVRCGKKGLFSLCEWRCIYSLAFSRNSFLDEISESVSSINWYYSKQLSNWFPFPTIIPVDKNTDLWTLIFQTDDHYFCLFAINFQPLLSSSTI